MKILKVKILMILVMLIGINLAVAEEATFENNKISGPHTYKNLTLFFVQGDNIIDVGNISTFGEALERNEVVVKETGNVGQLYLDNNSEYYVFIHAGTIVKGGRQDRVIRYDLLVQPASKQIPLESFCVESGRWTKRGDEDATKFDNFENLLSSKALKIAAKVDASQGQVWSEVDKIQDKLTYNVGTNVRGGRSATSLQLALENEDISKMTQDYIDFMSGKMKGSDNIIGMVFAINSQINSADIYGNATLFEKHWPKLIEACAIEAISELDKEANNPELTAQDIVNWMADPGLYDSIEITLNKLTKARTKESAENILIETIHKPTDKFLHKNMIKY